MILYLPLAAVELTEASLRKRKGGWTGITEPMPSIGMNLVGFGRGRPRILQSMKVFTSPTMRRLRSSSLLIVICRTSSTRMTISIIVSESMPEILDQAQVVVGILQLDPQVRLDEALDHADDDGRHVLGIARLAVLDRRLESRGRAALKRLAQRNFILGGKRTCQGHKRLVAALV